MGVGLEWPQVLTLYMLGLKGLVLGIPEMYHMSYVDVGLTINQSSVSRTAHPPLKNHL